MIKRVFRLAIYTSDAPVQTRWRVAECWEEALAWGQSVAPAAWEKIHAYDLSRAGSFPPAVRFRSKDIQARYRAEAITV